ncbi:hypothetical protein MUG87_18615 [Ectobacillus sp. JY-23]|jgi:hypothetical protein|uniref:hypothetical protein n=1 Tax=Ectobacillus sp. JY-23 TaxID=2933872 RepID=UPI001FF60B78|nr:hypothetical protein [Ectobacillus sp. JY-23]UOY92408.1 hypothetical protein MUG87_18615 [Ectobacillus sp. JY-23]
MNYLSGGYYLVKPASVKDSTDRGNNSTHLSASDCICDMYPDIFKVLWSGPKRQEITREELHLTSQEFSKFESWLNEGISNQSILAPPILFCNLDIVKT